MAAPTTQSTRPASPGAPRAGRRWRWRAGWCRWSSAPTSAARSARRRRSTVSGGTSRPGASYPYDGHYMPGTDSARTVLSVIGPIARDGDDLAAAVGIVADHPLAPGATSASPATWRILLLTGHPLGEGSGEHRRRARGARRCAGQGRRDRRPAQTDILPDLERHHAGYWALLNLAHGPPRAARCRAAAAARNLASPPRRAGAVATPVAPAVRATTTPSSRPMLGMTAFPHDPTRRSPSAASTSTARTRSSSTSSCWPGLATFPMLPATSFPIGKRRRRPPDRCAGDRRSLRRPYRHRRRQGGP